MLNHVCFHLPDPDTPCGDIELLTKFADWQAAMGKTCEEIRLALADGNIDKKEEQAITAAGYAHMARFIEFMERIHALTE